MRESEIGIMVHLPEPLAPSGGSEGQLRAGRRTGREKMLMRLQGLGPQLSPESTVFSLVRRPRTMPGTSNRCAAITPRVRKMQEPRKAGGRAPFAATIDV